MSEIGDRGWRMDVSEEGRKGGREGDRGYVKLA